MTALKSLQNQISFFIDCYKQENKNTRIEKISQKNVELFVETLIDDDLKFLSEGLYIPMSYEREASKILKVYRKEKELKFYFLGKKKDDGLVPLFVYDARMEDHGIVINFDSFFINICALEDHLDSDRLDAIEDELYEIGQKQEISKSLLIEIYTVFDQYGIPYNHTYSEIIKADAIETTMCYGIVSKSKNTRGVKEDLESISELKGHNSISKYSETVQSLFSANNNKSSHKVTLNYKLLPYTLSYGQFRIF